MSFTATGAHCSCGWRGSAVHPPTEPGQQSAEDEWDRHLRPLIEAEARRHTIRADLLLAFARELCVSATVTVDKRGEKVFTEHGRGLIDAANRLEDLLDELAQRA